MIQGDLELSHLVTHILEGNSDAPVIRDSVYTLILVICWRKSSNLENEVTYLLLFDLVFDLVSTNLNDSKILWHEM